MAERKEQEKAQRALMLYRKGLDLSEARKFAEATGVFQKAVSIDPQFHEAFEELAFTLYSLNRYKESADASKAAIRLNSNFNSFYLLGLAHFATGNWPEAKLAFGSSIELRNPSSWNDAYTGAYYYFGLSSAKLNEVRSEIRALENHSGDLNAPIKRFELANLYLCDGRPGVAKEQYRILRNSDPALADELLKLIKKHSKPA